MRGWVGSALVSFALPLALLGLPSTDVDAPATPATVTEFPLPHPESRPYTIVAGPDGNLWFTESWRGAIGRITPTGTITEFELDDPDSQPYGITLGADGNLWFTERIANKIGRITPTGMITEYEIPTPNAQPWDITAMPDGTFWFTEENVDQVAMIDQNGIVTEYPSGIGQFPTHITTGPDGNVWFTEEIGNNIVRLDPDDPENQTEFPIETVQALPWDIAPGPDGNLWFTELAGRNIGKITPQGTITEYPVPGDFGGIAGIAAAPSGNRLWFTENDTSNVGVIDVNGQVGETFDTTDYPFGITAGPDGNMWFCIGFGNAIGRVNIAGLLLLLLLRLHHRRLPTTAAATSAATATSTTSAATSTSATPATPTSAPAATTTGSMPRPTRHRLAPCSRKTADPQGQLLRRPSAACALQAITARPSHRAEPEAWRSPAPRFPGQPARRPEVDLPHRRDCGWSYLTCGIWARARFSDPLGKSRRRRWCLTRKEFRDCGLGMSVCGDAYRLLRKKEEQCRPGRFGQFSESLSGPLSSLSS